MTTATTTGISVDHGNAVANAGRAVAAMRRRAMTPVGSYYSDMMDGHDAMVATLRRAIRRAKAAGEAADEIARYEPYDSNVADLDLFVR